MLSYRCDVGVPGYTGVIPASGGVLVPSKDANLRTGKAVDPATATKARDFALFPGQDMESTYVKTLKAVPGATKPRDKTGGGYWIMDVGQGGGHGGYIDNPPTFFITPSTYEPCVRFGWS